MWVLYGANGYTGQLIAREAKKRGLNPILAGRNEAEIKALAWELGLRSIVFDCKEEEILKALKEIPVKAILHCAGPYSATSRPMIEACLKLKAHYLDITGEIPVFERILKKTEVFRDGGIAAIPGVGFDIVPSDCLAALLKRELPDASELRMALKITGGTSPGTTKTMVEGLHAGGVVRREGKLVRVPAAAKTRAIRFWKDFDDDRSTLFPWGDVATAFYSTGIPDIEFYVAATTSYLYFLKASRFLAPVLMLKSTQGLLKSLVELTIQGPDRNMLEKGSYYLWGEAIDPRGKRIEKRLKTPNGYNLTVDSALLALESVLAGKVAPGAWTPSQAFGADFVNRLKGVEWGT
jgi:short subunit dehydrogenase-like uncharacterized protein